jgi:flagellar basal-body rod protein FlgF
MTRGMYAAAMSMLVQSTKQDIVAANLANVSTPGYRRQVPSVAGYSRLLGDVLAATDPATASALSPAAALSPRPWLEVTTNMDLRPAGARATGNPCDLAIEGDGFFVVETPQGLAYTRAGNFRLDADHRLVTVDGDPVLGEGGPIAINGDHWEVAPNGDVLVDGAQAARIRLVSITPETGLRRLGDNLVATAEVPPPAEHAAIKQGYLESSNVSMIDEMATMITTLRAYEAAQRALTAQDETLGQLINEVSRVQ